MVNKVELRRDVHPTPEQIAKAQKPVTIFAPKWVEEALMRLSKTLTGRRFQILRNEKKANPVPLSEFTLEPVITLKQLQLMSRNEGGNTSGVIKMSNYDKDINQGVILALKDLGRQCVLIGQDQTMTYGGYPKGSKRIPQKATVFICDLPGLQFQKNHNSGRLVLYSKSQVNGDLDQFIFTNVVGEPKKSFHEVEKIVKGSYPEDGGRYILTKNSDRTYFDVFAYKQFVKNDVVLTGKGLCEYAAENQEDGNPAAINFKFLKYGTGFFAGKYKDYLESNILEAVVDGIEVVVEEDEGKTIKFLEFPFYNKPDKNSDAMKKLESLKAEFQVDHAFTRSDALKSVGPYMTATTNCADPHAAIGNKMNYGSVDSAICENLYCKGLQFLPGLNEMMKGSFLDI